MSTSDVLPALAYQTAVGFHRWGGGAAYHMIEADDGEHVLTDLMVAASNMSLAAELYLKTIHIVNGKRIKGHGLATLYAELPRSQQDAIDAEYTRRLEHEPHTKGGLNSFVLRLEPGEGDSETTRQATDVSTAVDLFRLHDRSFELWRYVFEVDTANPTDLEYRFDAVAVMLSVLHDGARNALGAWGEAKGGVPALYFRGGDESGPGLTI